MTLERYHVAIDGEVYSDPAGTYVYFDDAQAEIEQLRNKVDAWGSDTEILRLRGENIELKDEIERLKQTCIQHAQIEQSLTSEIERLKDEIEAAEKSIADQGDVIQRLKKENKELRKDKTLDPRQRMSDEEVELYKKYMNFK